MSIELALKKLVNDTWNYMLYMQYVASFDPELDFNDIKKQSLETYDFLTNSEPEELRCRLPFEHDKLIKMTNVLRRKYPLRKQIIDVAVNWNNLFREKKDPFSFGIDYGQLNELIDLSALHLYSDYIPFQLRVGLGHNKGYFSIEEDFLIKDSFDLLIKASATHRLLIDYSEKVKATLPIDKQQITPQYYSDFSNLKFEIASYSRNSLVSFYSFVECFVNSVGYSHLMYNKSTLSEDDQELLKGKRGKHYLKLKDKIKKYPRVISGNLENIASNVSTNSKFFEIYEQLRNSSVHFSPLKDSIWLKPEDWLEKALDFSVIALDITREFWQSCFPDSNGPEYLGKLNYKSFYEMAECRVQNRKKIEISLTDMK